MSFSNDFIDRHIGLNKKEVSEMLKIIGVKNVETLISETIPKKIRLKDSLNLSHGMNEPRYLEHIKNLGRKNKNYRSY